MKEWAQTKEQQHYIGVETFEELLPAPDTASEASKAKTSPSESMHAHPAGVLAVDAQILSPGHPENSLKAEKEVQEGTGDHATAAADAIAVADAAAAADTAADATAAADAAAAAAAPAAALFTQHAYLNKDQAMSGGEGLEAAEDHEILEVSGEPEAGTCAQQKVGQASQTVGSKKMEDNTMIEETVETDSNASNSNIRSPKNSESAAVEGTLSAPNDAQPDVDQAHDHAHVSDVDQAHDQAHVSDVDQAHDHAHVPDVDQVRDMHHAHDHALDQDISNVDTTPGSCRTVAEALDDAAEPAKDVSVGAVMHGDTPEATEVGSVSVAVIAAAGTRATQSTQNSDSADDSADDPAAGGGVVQGAGHGLIEEIAPQDVDELAPEDAKEIAPQDAKEIRPQEAKEIEPHGAKEVAPQDVDEIASQDVNQLAPQDVDEIAPQEAKYITPQDVDEMAPQGIKEVSPQDIQEASPQGVTELEPKDVQEVAPSLPPECAGSSAPPTSEVQPANPIDKSSEAEAGAAECTTRYPSKEECAASSVLHAGTEGPEGGEVGASLGAYKEDWDVGDVAEMCAHLDNTPEGSAVSYNKTLAIPASFMGLSRVDSKAVVAAVWPQRGALTKDNVEGKVGLYSLQTRPGDAVVCRMNARAKCIQDVAITLEDHQCILLDASCCGSMLQNITFEGGIVVCKGIGCNVIMESVRFNYCTLVVVDGAAVDLKHCDFKAAPEVGTGLCLMAHWAGTRVHASECKFSGGFQSIAVHSGARFQGMKIQCMGAQIQGVEAKDCGTRVSLSGNCVVADVDIQRRYVSSKLYSKGVFVHTEAGVTLDNCSVMGCVRAVEVATKATAAVNWCSTRGSLESGFRVDSAAKLTLASCSSEDDKHGCVVVGMDTSLRADTVAVLRSKGDGFQIFSRKGGVAELEECSAQEGAGNGVWVSGFGGHGKVTILRGWMQNNAKSGVQVWAGGEAEAKEVVTTGNSACGFRSHGAGSLLHITNCNASDNVATQEVDRGWINVISSSPERVLKHG